MTASLWKIEYDARQAVLDGILARYKTRGFWTPNLKKAALPLKVCDPHRVAFLRFRDVQATMSQPELQPLSPEAATQVLRQSVRVVGWRFLIYGHDAAPNSPPIAAAHAAINPRTGGYRLAELNEGNYVRGILRATKAFDLFVGRDAQHYDPLLLVVPSFFTAALWQRNKQILDTIENSDTDSTKTDYLIPILPADGDFLPFDVKKPNEFFDDLLKVKPADDPMD